MKRFLSLTIVLLATIISFAQTQQGIVKTRGRMVDGQLVEGKRLADATITLNFGNPLVSGSEGAFSFSVPAAKTYSLVSATKQGYTLADPEYTRCSFTYSAQNPFYVVLEDEAQRQADINAATRKIRRTLLARLEKFEEEIETLKEQNKLTEQEYQERLQQLYDNQSNSEKLIKEMAERYATTDYDQLDEFNRQVQMYIEDGELQKADSLIRSKGNMEQRVAEYHNAVAANKERREEWEQEGRELEQSESGTARTYEDLSQDLYRRHEIFLQKFQQDSALYCLKIRADLDTTNMKVVLDYATLCNKQKKFMESESYYQICLRIAIRNNDLPNVALIQNDLGVLYNDIQDHANSEKYLKLSLSNTELLFQQTPTVYRADLEKIQNNLGVLYFRLHDYTNAEKFYKLALENSEQLFKENPTIYCNNLAKTQNNLGVFYRTMRNYESSKKYLMLALENLEQLFKLNPDLYYYSIASTQNSLGNLYYALHDYSNSLKYFLLALENYNQLFLKNPDAYRSELAHAQGNVGSVYSDLGDYANSEKYYMLTLETYEKAFELYSNVYREHLSIVQQNIGLLYVSIKDFAKSEIYLKLALENTEILFEQNQGTYRENLAKAQNSLGQLYGCLGDYANAEKYFKLSLDNFEQLSNQHPDVYRVYLASAQNNLGVFYFNLKDYENSERYLKLCLETYNRLFKQNPEVVRASLARTQGSLGLLYYIIHDYASSEKYYKMSLENREQLYKKNPAAYRESVVITQKNLACSSAGAGKFNEALETIDKAIALMPDNADLYDSKGEIFLMQGKTQEALEMWKKVLELNPNFLNDYPDGTELSNGLKKLGLIE